MSWNDGDRREYRSGCCVTKPPNVEVTVGLGGGAEAGRAGGVCREEPALPWTDLPGDCSRLRPVFKTRGSVCGKG